MLCCSTNEEPHLTISFRTSISFMQGSILRYNPILYHNPMHLCNLGVAFHVPSMPFNIMRSFLMNPLGIVTPNHSHADLTCHKPWS